MPTFHFPIGGSTADRTFECPGWLKASEGITPRPAGQAAIDGSMHHEIMEMCFLTGTTPADHVGHVYEEDGQTREFLKTDYPLSKKAFNTMNALLDELDIDEFLVEPLVTLIPDLAGGSIDMLGISDDRKTALVADYKFGRNIVTAENNRQGLFYVISAMADPETNDLFKEVDTLVIAIIQPQSKNGLSRWTCDMQTVENFRGDMLAAIGKTGYLK